jgi:hypothetical protein
MVTMTLEDFEASLTAPAPAAGLPPLLEALWHERHGDWTRAHQIAQDVEDGDGAWVHAYLHRREGDIANAGYWYRRAGRRAAAGPLDDEWRAIVGDLLAR